ncbi:MAG: class I SAM-dependent methyltransferase [Bacteroidota bacterium]|nr:class I SAM-dependent methyltransferase [Bacteroidota bacterium]
MGLKKRLIRFFQDKIGIGENRDKIKELESRISYQNQLIQRVLPEIFPMTQEEKTHGYAFLKELGLADQPDLSIHKNDIMFRLSYYRTGGDLRRTLQAYLKTGYEIARDISSIANEKGVEAKSFLDFGAGYGRVSRFFPFTLPGARIWVSEIKPQSLDFLKDRFAFSPILHSEAPDSLVLPEKMDIIFAGSVFTHLPKALFEPWLDTLLNGLEDNGILIFSTHNKLDYPEAKGDFHFTESSEDTFMVEVEDRLEDAKKYGVTYVSDRYIRDLLNSKDQISWESRRLAFGKTQDLVICQRAAAINPA